MENLITTLQKIEKLSEEELQALEQLRPFAKYKSIKKGDYISKPGHNPETLVYVENGILRHYTTDKNGNEKIVQFFMEGAFFDNCSTFSPDEDYAVQAICDADIIYFDLTDLVEFSGRFPISSKIEYKIQQLFLKNHHEHLMILMKYTPEERYKYLIQHKASLVQRVSVTHLAQFLDMSRETLSRMRAKIFETDIL